MIIQTHKFTKDVDPTPLQNMIMLDDTLRGVVESISVTRNQDGTIPNENISVGCNRVLISEEFNLLAEIFNNYSPDHRLVKRHFIKNQYVTPGMAFGLDFLAEYSANNIERGKTSEQILAMMMSYPLIPILCMAGSMETLLGQMTGMTEGPFISQEEIDEFKKRLAIYLGLI